MDSPSAGSVEPALDHLVYAAPDLAAAVEAVAERLGVRPVEGGRHPGLGTRNHLLGLGGAAYLEVIGPDLDQPDPGRPRPFGIDDLTAPALVTWAVRPPDLDGVLRRARAAGTDPGDARPMSRRTPSGELLRWRLTEPGSRARLDGGLLPFLIDWLDSPHPTTTGLPAVRLVAMSARHPDPGRIGAALAALAVHLDVRAGERAELAAVLHGPRGDVVLG